MFSRKNKIKIDLTKVPEKEFIKQLIDQVKERYPNFYKVVIEDRNKVMAKNLYTLISKNNNSKILAIIGAGHEEDLIQELKRVFKNKVQ